MAFVDSSRPLDFFFVHERFEDICDAMKFGVDKKISYLGKRVFQRGKCAILLMARVINSISDIFCVVSFYLIRTEVWEIPRTILTFPWGLKIAVHLRYMVPKTAGNIVSKCFMWLAVIFREKNTRKMSENSGKTWTFPLADMWEPYYTILTPLSTQQDLSFHEMMRSLHYPLSGYLMEVYSVSHWFFSMMINGISSFSSMNSHTLRNCVNYSSCCKRTNRKY